MVKIPPDLPLSKGGKATSIYFHLIIPAKAGIYKNDIVLYHSEERIYKVFLRYGKSKTTRINEDIISIVIIPPDLPLSKGGKATNMHFLVYSL